MKKLLVFLLTTLLMVSACAAADGLTPGDGIVALENGAHIDLDGDGVEETVAGCSTWTNTASAKWLFPPGAQPFAFRS